MNDPEHLGLPASRDLARDHREEPEAVVGRARNVLHVFFLLLGLHGTAEGYIGKRPPQKENAPPRGCGVGRRRVRRVWLPVTPGSPAGAAGSRLLRAGAG